MFKTAAYVLLYATASLEDGSFVEIPAWNSVLHLLRFTKGRFTSLRCSGTLLERMEIPRRVEALVQACQPNRRGTICLLRYQFVGAQVVQWQHESEYHVRSATGGWYKSQVFQLLMLIWGSISDCHGVVINGESDWGSRLRNTIWRVCKQCHDRGRNLNSEDHNSAVKWLFFYFAWTTNERIIASFLRLLQSDSFVKCESFAVCCILSCHCLPFNLSSSSMHVLDDD